MSDDPPSNGPDRLNGWKEIATYLGKSVSSVQRWERQLKLPVRRIKTTDGQIVGASRREFDAWRTQLEIAGQRLDADAGDEIDAGPSTEPADSLHVTGAASSRTTPRPGPPYARPAFALFGVLTVLALGFGFRSCLLPAPAARPAAFVLVGTKLEFRDRADQTIDSYAFGRDVSGIFAHRQVGGVRDDELAAVDLDGDGSIEHLVAVHFGPPDKVNQSTDGLYAFSDARKMLWNAVPDFTFSCGGKKFEGPWRLNAVQVSSGSAPKRIWLAYAHHKDSISFVVEVKPDGHQSLRYVQYGWIMSLAEWITPAGPRIVAGGVVHSEDRPSVALVDPDSAPAYFPNTDARITCDDAPAARPVRVVLLPNTDVTIAQGTPYAMVNNLRVVGGDLEAEADDLVVTFGPDGTVKDVTLGDVYWGRHRNLEAEGKLHHSASDCPELTKPHEIVTWTNGGPRQTYLIQPANTRAR
jgi:hypothetical protein